MSRHRRTKYKKNLPKGPNGYNLCRCGCKRECAPPRVTFFNDQCVHEYLLRSRTDYLRKAVFERDKGICSRCDLDCELLRLEMAVLKHKNVNAYKKKMIKLGWHRARKTYWDAHHIVAVAEGGGECGLDNIATLCLGCHKIETDELNIRLQNDRERNERDKPVHTKRARQNDKRARRLARKLSQRNGKVKRGKRPVRRFTSKRPKGGRNMGTEVQHNRATVEAGVGPVGNSKQELPNASRERVPILCGQGESVAVAGVGTTTTSRKEECPT